MALSVYGALPSPCWEDSFRTPSVLQYKSVPFLIPERGGKEIAYIAKSPVPNRFCCSLEKALHVMLEDEKTTVAQLRSWIERFVADRDWQQFHSPKNLSMALAIEVAELMEHFQWISPEESLQIDSRPERLHQVAEELADVLCYALALANVLKIDVSRAVREKLVKNAQKYPVEEYRGRYGPEDVRK